MTRLLLLVILIALVAQVLSRIVAQIRVGLTQPPGSDRVPQRGVQMVRDPVCGTFVVPDRALMLTEGSQRLYFCSPQCRGKYRASSR